MRWTALALIGPSWHATPIQSTPANITGTVRFAPLPSWFESAFDETHSKAELGEHLNDSHAFCLQTVYEAPAPVSGQGVGGEEHEKAQSELQVATTLLWIVRRTSFGFNKFILAEEDPTGWTWREISSHEEAAPLRSYLNVDIESSDFAEAYALWDVYRQATVDGTVRTALNALSLARIQRSWPLRFLTLWLALEGLFGPTDARETTFRLCQRIALFISGKGEAAVKLFGRVNESYRWRSKAVHGLRLQKLNDRKSEELLEEAEALVQESLKKILSDESLAEIFDSNAREAYLDNLALI
jgi:hypothetical protein